jgi:hypothetical protein
MLACADRGIAYKKLLYEEIKLIVKSPVITSLVNNFQSNLNCIF